MVLCHASNAPEVCIAHRSRRVWDARLIELVSQGLSLNSGKRHRPAAKIENPVLCSDLLLRDSLRNFKCRALCDSIFVETGLLAVPIGREHVRGNARLHGKASDFRNVTGTHAP